MLLHFNANTQREIPQAVCVMYNILNINEAIKVFCCKRNAEVFPFTFKSW